MYEPQHIERWTMPDSYGGEVWPDYFVFLGQHRDSDTLARSNFISGLAFIGGETETVIVVRENHWAVGWVEWIAIHASDDDALEKADGIVAALSDYPVVSEDHFSEMEWDEAADYWEKCHIKHRIEYCKEAGLSIFAARHDYLPHDPSGRLFEALRG